MKQINIKKLLIPNLPYLLIGLYASKIGQAYRLLFPLIPAFICRIWQSAFYAARLCGWLFTSGARTPRNTAKMWNTALPGGELPQTSSPLSIRYLRTTLS